jgi:2-keto-4-pentenoate hydratase
MVAPSKPEADVAGAKMGESAVDVFAEEISGIYRDHRLSRTGNIDIQQLSIDEAYSVQQKYLARRIAKGERTIGYKVGCTSPAIQTQFGLSQPICGRLLAPHIYNDGETLFIDDYVNCSLEAELVFHIGIDVDGTNVEAAFLRSAIAAVSPGIEVHNYRFWYGSPTSQELIASNGIHAALVVGTARALTPDVDLGEERNSLVVNQDEVSVGFGAELMNGLGPIGSLGWLVSHLRKANLRLLAGDLVIPGAVTKLVPVKAGDAAEARFTHFGVCHAKFSNSRGGRAPEMHAA